MSTQSKPAMFEITAGATIGNGDSSRSGLTSRSGLSRGTNKKIYIQQGSKSCSY